MPGLKPIEPKDRFIDQVVQLRKQLDQIINEYQDSIPRKDTGPVEPYLTNHRTGEKIKIDMTRGVKR